MAMSDYETVMLLGENIGEANGYAIILWENVIAFKNPAGFPNTIKVSE